MVWYPSGNMSDSLLPGANDSLIVTPFYDTYYVEAYSTPEGCTSYDTVLVSVWFQDTLTTDSVAVGINIALPNSFSPNGDNVNDGFIIQNIDDYKDLSQLTIYNRWGDRVWQSEYLYDNANPWRGTNQNGTKLADGVYMYTLELLNASDDYEYSVNGTVTILDAQ